MSIRASCTIISPSDPLPLECHAARELSRYIEQMTGRRPSVSAAARLRPGRTHFILGPPARNAAARDALERGGLEWPRALPRHPESFAAAGGDVDGAHVVLLSGSRPVGTLYAVYDYLERVCGYGFFQDGEQVPKLAQLPAAFAASVQEPRFDHRLHLAWNAHRGIKKYHSFWWTLDEWKRELDWMAKRRLNLIRLDMGHYARFSGDTFEEVFPEIGPEPDGVLYPRLAGWVAACGWPPAYRRKLTQQILEYGRSLGIRFVYALPYAEVPFRFHKAHPEYKYLPGNQYGESRELSPYDSAACDVERARLAKIVELFGTDHLYMYTPYAEVDVGGGSLERNLDMRIRAGKTILKLIRDVDPDGTWVTDTWDMIDSSRRWNPKRVKRYLDSFPTGRMLLYETAADVTPLYRKYGWWHGKPWAFGVLQSFAGKEALHGNAPQLIERVQAAAACPTCAGLFMVPESTHHNVMIWDLVTRLAWQPDGVAFDGFLEDFVARRYGREAPGAMLAAWRKIAEAVYMRPSPGIWEFVYRGHPWYHWPKDSPLFGAADAKLRRRIKSFGRELPLLRDALSMMLKQRQALGREPLYVEDVVTVFREVAARRFNCAIGDAFLAFRKGDAAAFKRHRDRAMSALRIIQNVLAACPSYSINRTIAEARRVRGCNKFLPQMIRQACLNIGYVNNDVTEQFGGQYIPKTRAYFALLADKLARGDRRVFRCQLRKRFEQITTDYRERGWRGEDTKQGDPVRRVAAAFKKLTSGR